MRRMTRGEKVGKSAERSEREQGDGIDEDLDPEEEEAGRCVTEEALRATSRCPPQRATAT